MLDRRMHYYQTRVTVTALRIITAMTIVGNYCPAHKGNKPHLVDVEQQNQPSDQV